MANEVTIREPMGITPAEVVENATTQAKLLMNIVDQTKCFQEISGKKYLQVEAWETIGAFNRTHAETESIEPINKEGEVIGYSARAQLWKDGEVVGGAIMPCFFTENCCKGKEGDAKHKAAMSAAQTFATSKAYRMNFSYVAILAGYQPLPFEEVTEDMHQPAQPHTNEHWCEKHNTKFFKTEKMKAWAHPVKNEDGSPTLDDNGKQLWCSEKPQPQAKPDTSQEPARSKSEVVKEAANGNLPEEAEPEPDEVQAVPEVPSAGKMPKPDRDPSSLNTFIELQKACHADFGMQPKDVLQGLNVESWSELTETPADCYRSIQASRQ